MVCVREKLPDLRWLRINLSTSTPTAKVEMFLGALKKWEREGYGRVEERNDGIIYVEEGGQQGALRSGDEQET